MSTTDRFNLVSLSDLFSAPEAEYEWVVDGLAPAGALSLVGAKPKTGKSTLARNISLAVATGQPVIGRETVQGTVIDLSLEEKASEIKRHYTAMGAEGNEPIIVHVGQAPPDPLLALEAAIREHRPSLVTIDPMQRFLRVGDLNDYSETTRVFEPLVEIARRYNTHIMLLHHIGKGEHLTGISDGFIGSTAIFASVDIGIIMRKKDEARTIQTDGPQRFDVDLPETLLTLDAETGRLSAGKVLATAQREELEQRVIDAVADMWLPMTDIKKAIGGDATKVHTAVTDLYKNGYFERDGTGKSGDGYRYRFRQPDPSVQKPNGHDKRAEINRMAAEYIEERQNKGASSMRSI